MHSWGSGLSAAMHHDDHLKSSLDAESEGQKKSTTTK
jgi:hypothetical protein